VDGNDAVLVDETAARLIAEVRGGSGPRLLHAPTYRLTGHTSTDPAHWREAGEVETARMQEPILRLRARLLAEGASIKALDTVEGDARAEMSAARAAALAAPWPDLATAWDDVQDDGAFQGAA
jgi:pyruvate dehydrogenase E1 component alpha subunit